MQGQMRKLLSRFKEVEELLAQADISNQKTYQKLAQEHSYLSEIKDKWLLCENLQKQLQENQSLLKEEKDLIFAEFIRQEIADLEKKISVVTSALEHLLIPPDPFDSRNVILEMRAGTGGDEAAIFVGNCVRMYKLYADFKGWKHELLSCTSSEAGGFKEYFMVLSGHNVHRCLQYEAGTHRVQRVPKTETQGRVHTSAVTVAILVEPDENEKIVLDEKELKIDTYRASGAGGQHVNTTDSAVRITHIPSGLVASCQEERSQHKNKDKAKRLLIAKLAERKKLKAEQEVASIRSSQVGTGDRSGRIRTYNFPQNRVTDHRIDLTLYKLNLIMEGDLEEIVNALVAYFYQKKLEGVGKQFS